MSIGFSSKFLQEFLMNLETPEIIFKLSHTTGPGLLFPVYAEDEKVTEDIMMLVMPVMLNA